ncbi:hypothetical protein [Exiguobacterium aurantiacum]|uniref:Uncharacterized protein n=1 Tax=Exiguobacterium aurantiacum TaxID=33987 RepID=A0ABY5FMT6_9BACL|nr:hypothetical protein [Exiguobacterium aurantiacum]UTT42862.1 hypothetical protein NMQ00_15315 [Exiguobacterium aurantiacum]
MTTKRKPRWVYRLRRALLFIPAIVLTVYAWPHEPADEEIDDAAAQTDVTRETGRYTIVARQAVKEDESVRYAYDVVVHGQPDVETLQSISHDVIDEVTARDTFQAALIRFYDHEAYVGTESPLGEAVFAPDGDWSLADMTEPGTYEDMTFGWQLIEKEWDAQLTDQEANVWEAWNRVYEAEQSDDPDLKAKVTRAISTKYDLNPETVQQIVLKQNVWAAL